MMTHSPMVIGLPPEQLRAFVEAHVGPLGDLPMLDLMSDRPVSHVKQTQRWLVQWALAHPDTSRPGGASRPAPRWLRSTARGAGRR